LSDQKYEFFRRELNLQEKLSPLSQIKKIRKLLNNEIIIKHIGKGVLIDIICVFKHIINMTFGLINEGLKTTTASGQY
jgi:hypothetical protein